MLRDTGARVWPYYIHRIQPHVMRGESVLIAAHGNSLRALIMALDGLTRDEIVKRELATGLPIVYRLNADTTVAEKEELTGMSTPAAPPAPRPAASGTSSASPSSSPAWRRWPPSSSPA